MSAQDYNTVRSLKLHEIQGSELNKRLVRQYAMSYCTGFMRDHLLKLAA
ncbi:hypothetical protein R7R25_23830 [Vibrio sp. 2026]|nr:MULTISPECIES: hypothetical protein [unclassified Vibrio]MDG2839984.1 hypothetical protein [Vibrio parahaemolyticus]MDW2121646.1 hypothetical protein [Vibrio sp. 2026]MDW2210164.1 hypothetical protein [Vibrio sp. 2025]